jgi:PDZ domain-containing protein
MKRTIFNKIRIQIPLGQTAFDFGISWLVVIPAGLWVIATIYVPILGAPLNNNQAWLVSGLIVLMILISLVIHSLAHVLVSRLTGGELPRRIPQYILGEAAQVWPAGGSAGKEALIALSGPLASLILAGLAYPIWNAQFSPYLNLSSVFVGAFNALIAIINLTPAFPFDGGRILRAILWGIVRSPENSNQIGKNLGLLLSVALIGWGVFLSLQRARFSPQTSTLTLMIAGLILLELYFQPTWKWSFSEARGEPVKGLFLRAGLASLLILVMLAVPASLVPTNDGLEAPGIALSVEPMVKVPQQYLHSPEGTFILTTVIPQTPILAGEWAFAKLSPTVRLVPPEQIVPANTTPQEVARQGTQMLNESEQTAVAVGLQLAGYNVKTVGEGVKVVSIEPGSPSNQLLQPGDVITSLNGESTLTVPDLINKVQAQPANSTVELQILRNGQPMTLKVPLMPPTKPGDPPRIGITVESAGFKTELPFPVEIIPQKIAGGPSAGLMFTLTVYNMVTPQDLTGGRKIAGTGTISLDGTVGPIGGVEQKVAAAEGAGAEYFLSPPQNYAAAKSVANHIKVVQVATAEQAIQFLQSLPPKN